MIAMLMMTSTVTNITNTQYHSSWSLPLTENGSDDEYHDGDDDDNIKGDVHNDDDDDDR